MNLPLDKKDILLAEDDIDDVDIFKMALDSLDLSFELRNAQNGEALFVMLKDRVPYLLFLDINMPCKDGVSCIREIRSDKDYDHLPIIMYSSITSIKEKEECYRNGANLYVLKTTTLYELVNKLKIIFSYNWDYYLPYPPFDKFVLS